MLNQASDSHVPFPGTILLIALPDGFVPTKKALGFEHPRNAASITCTMYQGTPAGIKDMVSAKQLSGQGLRLLEEKPLRFNNSEAFWVKASGFDGNEKFTKAFLVVGHEQTIFVVIGKWLSTDGALEKKIQTAMYSVGISKRNTATKIQEPYELPYKDFGCSYTKSENHYNFYDCGEVKVQTVHFLKPTISTEMVFFQKVQQLPFTSTKFDSKNMHEFSGVNFKGLMAGIIGLTESEEIGFASQFMLETPKGYFVIQALANDSTLLAPIAQLVKKSEKVK